MIAFFKHFGSKGRLADELPPPYHDIIVEPFAGSAAFSVAHAKPGQKVLLYDTDERVAGIWRWLITADESEILDIPVQKFLRGADIRNENWLTGPRREFVKRWLSITGTHANKLAPCLQEDPLRPGYTRDGTPTSNVISAARFQRIAAQLKHIRNWEIYQSSYDTAPDIEAHWHIDPPYQGNAHGLSEYKCEALDYQKLAIWCRSRRGSVTVHEQKGAKWLPFVTLKHNHRSSSRVSKDDSTKKTAHEVYYSNEYRDKTGTLGLFQDATS